MRNKYVVLKKVYELNTSLNSFKSLISIAKSREELFAQIEKIQDKLTEIEVLINREEDKS